MYWNQATCTTIKWCKTTRTLMHAAECTCPETTQAPPQSKSGKKQVQLKLFLLLSSCCSWCSKHTAQGHYSQRKQTTLKDKAGEAQLCFGYMVLGLMPLVGKKGLLCPWKPSWDYLWGKIPTISIDRNKDLRLKRCSVSDTKYYYGISHWPWEKKPQSCVLKSSMSPVLEKGLLSALNI